MGLSDQLESDWKEIFDLYDTDRDGKLSKVEFISAVRVCGRRYTADQMSSKMKAFGDSISFDTFSGFLCDPYTGPTEDDLRAALTAFDGRDCGELTLPQITQCLTSMGDKLTTEEAKAVVDAVPHRNGRITIDALTAFLNPPMPSTTPNVPELLKEMMREEAAAADLDPMPPTSPPPPPTQHRDPMEIPGATDVVSEHSSSVSE